MTVKYVQFEVSIHGIAADDDAIDLLRGLLQEAIKSVLLGEHRERFKFRNDLDSDIEVEVSEQAG